MGNKTGRGYTKIVAYYPEAFANANAPTSTELNSATYGFDISCAVTDDYTLNLKDSDTDNTQSVCDIMSIENPTFYNYEASLDGFADLDQSTASTGTYNKFRDLFSDGGNLFILVKRIGQPQAAVFDTSSIISAFLVKTDNPADIDAAGAPMGFGARFKPQGWVLSEYKVAS